MADIQTVPTTKSVTAFLKKIQEKQKRDDSVAILEMMRKISKHEPVMWGPAIIGFGTTHYVYESGREGDMPLIAFSPRKQNIVLYLEGGHKYVADELTTLGKYKTGKFCLYINSLSDVKVSVLKKIFVKAYTAALRNKRAAT